MKVGDLVREISKLDRKCSMGLVLKTRPVGSDFYAEGREEYLVHFFDDNDRCWMNKNFVEAINAGR